MLGSCWLCYGCTAPTEVQKDMGYHLALAIAFIDDVLGDAYIW